MDSGLMIRILFFARPCNPKGDASSKVASSKLEQSSETRSNSVSETVGDCPHFVESSEKDGVCPILLGGFRKGTKPAVACLDIANSSFKTPVNQLASSLALRVSFCFHINPKRKRGPSSEK